jgi:hypothetical protein
VDGIMGLEISDTELAKIPYLDRAKLGDRVLYLLPFWDGERWHLWLPQADGSLLTMHPRDAAQSDYVAEKRASENDLPILFLNFIWQRASLPGVHRLLGAMLDDFHSLATSVAKIDHFFTSYEGLGFGSTLFVATELEYLLIRCRGVFDHLQGTISVLWDRHVHLIDPVHQKGKRIPPQYFAHVLFESNKDRSPQRIVQKYQFPLSLAEAYCGIRPFFASVRDSRNRIVHGMEKRRPIFHTDRGWCVASDDPAFTQFQKAGVWTEAHRFNTRLVSLRPLLAHLVFGTMSACGELLSAFAKEIMFPEALAPAYTVFVRSLHGAALARLNAVIDGASPWWNDNPQLSAPA